MRLLLDTNVFFWWHSMPQRISRETYDKISAPTNLVCASVVTWWELGIKRALGKITLHSGFDDEDIAPEFAVIEVTLDDAKAAPRLPMHHRDPFDRMLIAQAQLRNLTIVTADRAFANYDIGVMNA